MARAMAFATMRTTPPVALRRAGAARGARKGAASATPLAARDARRRGALQRANSLFGVGAPEALVIGVVSLLVFGPKGLADIAKQLGATLREFQPTIRELQDVSREFQDTLRDEIEKPLEDAVTGATPSKRAKAAGDGALGREDASVAFDTRAVRATGADGTDVDTVTEEMKGGGGGGGVGRVRGGRRERERRGADRRDDRSGGDDGRGGGGRRRHGLSEFGGERLRGRAPRRVSRGCRARGARTTPDHDTSVSTSQ